MKCYFASYSTQPEIGKGGGQNLLETYHSFKNKDFVAYHKKNNILGNEIFLDSGAFSAFTQGAEIDIDKYIEFIKSNKSILTVYAGLDVIGDWQATRKNIEYMESKGLRPIPTFHYGSPYEELERLVQKYDYIALGGLVPISKNIPVMKAHLDKCFSIIKLRCRVHGFGVNGFWAWERYPFYSVDATTWLMGGIFRNIIEFDEKQGKFITTSKNKNNNSHLFRLAHNAHYKEINNHTAKELLKARDFVTRLWLKRGVDWAMWEKRNLR